MPITNEVQLQNVLRRIGADLQDVQNHLGDTCRRDAKFRFPRGFIRRAADLRKRFGFLRNDTLKRNLSYQLILSDVFRWILNRSDITGTAQEMLIKEGICLFGSQCETILRAYCGNRTSKKKGVPGRIQYLVSTSVLDSNAADERNWLWKTRSALHVYLVEQREHQIYKISDYNRARNAYRSLGRSISEYEVRRLKPNA
jgi:hypothetical protein